MSLGIRWYRSADMDALPTGGVPERSELLREIVDKLPPVKRHLIERTFFGGAPLTVAAKEIGKGIKYARQLRNEAIEDIRQAMYPDAPRPRPLPAAGEHPVDDGVVPVA